MGKDSESLYIKYNNLATKAYAQGDYRTALDFFKKMIGINPEPSNPYFMIGHIYSDTVLHSKNNRFDVVGLENPTYFPNQNNTLNATRYDYIKDFASAIDYFKQYVQKEPQDAKVYVIIAYLYKLMDYHGYMQEQIEYFKKALEFMPDSKDIFRNLAYAYVGLENSQEAAKYFEKSFSNETSANEYFTYGCAKIKLGDFEKGWKYYEYRFVKDEGKIDYPTIDKPKWEGQMILDKTLLVQYEQGFGDCLQFFRYVLKVKPLAKKVIFRVHNELVDLFKTNASGIEIVPESTPISDLSFDYHIPLLNLVKELDFNLDNVPLKEGYIKADTQKTKKYKKEYFDNECFKIGIAWHGAEDGNILRNILLEVFYPLCKMKNVQVYSFQKGVGSEQIEQLPPGIEIIDLGKTFNDFSDTAAAMANLDLFISSDNGVLNLAGAMGKKSFLLLNKPSNWRWFFDDDTTRWYDSVKIFKKKR